MGSDHSVVDIFLQVLDFADAFPWGMSQCDCDFVGAILVMFFPF